MPDITVRIQSLADLQAGKNLIELKEGESVTEGRLTDFCILEGGTAEGNTSVSFIGVFPDGKKFIFQTTGKMFSALNAALNGAEARFKEGK